MAEILITGVEMPVGNNVLLVDSAGTITKLDLWKGTREATDPFSAKARELPAHGELLNRDNILFLLQAEALGIDPKDKDFEGIKRGLLLARKAVNEAVSVIPASRG